MPVVNFSFAFLGMSGTGPLVEEVASEVLKCKDIIVESDTVNAWAGATGCKPGVITIAGTGSVSFGVNEQGERNWSAYWAYLFGDEGSGYYLGRQALIMAARAYDGRGPDTSVLNKLLKRLNRKTMDEVRDLVYNQFLKRHEIADLARVLIEAAQEGDEMACSELTVAGNLLGQGAAAVIRNLKMVEKELTVCPVGGIFKHSGELLKRSYRETVQQAARLVVVKEPEFPSVVGSVFIALKNIGVDLTLQVINRIREGIESFQAQL
jgi:N-acetylglucosamine kinase-like BadF-type ATPase